MQQIKKKIFYWSPFIVNIATPKSVINSVISINKYSQNYSAYIINFFKEFDIFKNSVEIDKNKFLEYFNFNLINKLPKYGKIRSRLSFLIIFSLSIFPFHSILKKHKPEFLIIHLITSLPLLMLILFNYKTKFILRISGYPHLGFFRKMLWKLAFKKLYAVTCPTINTYNYIKSMNFADNSKIKVLYDPVINIKKINYLRKQKIIKKKNYYLAVGRLTKQKNFLFLVKSFSKIVKEDKYAKLLIAGEGEDREKIEKFIQENKLEDNISLLGYIKNIYPYFSSAKGFILTSLWEDPGFVLIEASFFRLPIFSANSKPGPIEIIIDQKTGTTFENNNLASFAAKFDIYKKNIGNKKILINNLKYIKNYTLFNHYKTLTKIISEN